MNQKRQNLKRRTLLRNLNHGPNQSSPRFPQVRVQRRQHLHLRHLKPRRRLPKRSQELKIHHAAALPIFIMLDSRHAHLKATEVSAIYPATA